jgi:4'-phosphopantetheinyl transferase
MRDRVDDDTGRPRVRLHTIDLDRPTPPSDRLEGLLDAAERRRAAAFRFDRDRARYVVGRAALRRVLGAALSLSPRQVPLVSGVHGKPRLESGGGPGFNVSHSERVCVIAVAEEGATDVGVDIEVVRPFAAPHAVARRVFVGPELDRVLPVGDAEGWRRFYRHWTAKEAVLKLLGTGLSRDPRTIRVRLRDDGTFTVDPAEPGSAFLAPGGVHLDPLPHPGEAGTVVVGAVAVDAAALPVVIQSSPLP